MAAFPSDIACIIAKGYNEELPFKKKYINRQGDAPQPLVNATALTNTDEKMVTFTRWYLDNGDAPFTLSLPLYGLTRDWNVRIVEKITTAPRNIGAFIRDMPMKLEILDDIKSIIPA